jgi:uncharacterized protein
MLSQRVIEEAVQRVVKAANNPLQVILFGSYGRGDAIGTLDIGVDLLVYSEADFELRKNWCPTPVYRAVREGKVLYDSNA